MIKAIKHLTVNSDLSSGSNFTRPTNLAFQPDMAIIRQISYSGPTDHEAGNFLIWSNLINDFIGTFNVGAYCSIVNPQSQLVFTSPVPNQLQFQIFTVVAGGTTEPYTALQGDLTIQIEFQKFAN